MSVFIIRSDDGIVYVRDSGVSAADSAFISSLVDAVDELEAEVESFAEGFEGGTW